MDVLSTCPPIRAIHGAVASRVLSKALERLVDLGLAPGTPIDLAFALRATNLGALLMALLATGGVGMWLAAAHSPAFALAEAGCVAAYLTVLFVASIGAHDAARFALILVACVDFGMTKVALGPNSGQEFPLLALVLYPVCGFTRLERTKNAVAYAIVGLQFVVSEFLMRRSVPIISLDPREGQQAVYFTLLGLAIGLTYWLRYYQHAAFLARRQLDDANRHIAELLANVLPPPIVARLEHQVGVIAESRGEATVLFADLVGFSTLARRL